MQESYYTSWTIGVGVRVAIRVYSQSTTMFYINPDTKRGWYGVIGSRSSVSRGILAMFLWFGG